MRLIYSSVDNFEKIREKIYSERLGQPTDFDKESSKHLRTN